MMRKYKADHPNESMQLADLDGRIQAIKPQLNKTRSALKKARDSQDQFLEHKPAALRMMVSISSSEGKRVVLLNSD